MNVNHVSFTWQGFKRRLREDLLKTIVVLNHLRESRLENDCTILKVCKALHNVGINTLYRSLVVGSKSPNKLGYVRLVEGDS